MKMDGKTALVPGSTTGVFRYVAATTPDAVPPAWLAECLDQGRQIMIRLDKSDHDLISLFEHDLFEKPVSTFSDHAPAC